MKPLWSLYRPGYATTLVYMLQNVEYRVGPYLRWFWRTNNFSTVTQRRQLERTRAARLLLVALRTGMLLQLAAGVWLMWAGWQHQLAGGLPFGAAMILSYPIVWAHLVAIPLLLGRVMLVAPKERRLIKRADQIFQTHPGVKIAVAGSYGKTSMKELLAVVLAEGKLVAATPGNKNVSISHAYFAQRLTGQEDVLIIEYGEGAPGDVAAFARHTQPTHAVITGLAPAHLDRYKTLAAAGRDIFSLADYLHDQQVYVNGESKALESYCQPAHHRYSRQGLGKWTVHDLTVSLTGTSFTLDNGTDRLQLHSGLIGAHQVGPLVAVASLAMELGLSPDQVVAGIAKTKPYEHRMQPYNLGGATIIDDTYNGNLEGIRAGTELLAALSATRKIYVTPGLVDQGKEQATIHRQVGQLIAAAQPNIVVLMQNSTTSHIREGLIAAHYAGDIQIEAKPLAFYANLDQWVAAGDVVLMQNDWTDNYH